MKNYKLIKTTLFILILSLTAFGQADKNKSDKTIKPDFSGTWVIDESKNKDFGYDLTLIVVHKEPEMKITKIYNFKGAKKTVEQTYYTDGSSVPESPMGFSTVSQKSHWQSSGRLVHTQQASKDGGKTIEQTITEKWELSTDGKILTLSTNETSSIPSKNAMTGQTSTATADVATVFRFKRGTYDIE